MFSIIEEGLEMYQNKTRREFLEFMGRGALLASVSPLISSCSISEKKNNFQKFLPIPPSTEDRLILASPFKYTVLASWGDTINSQGETFGFNCDYIACLPSLAGDFNEQIIWVNHESVNPIFVSGYQKNGKRTKQQVEKEQLEVGGSFIKIQRQSPHSPWKMVKDDKINRRFSGKTKIPFVADRKIAGSDFAIGTLGNCAGGVTPWNTILTCEENYYHFYGEVKWKDNQPVGRKKAKYLKWDSFFDYSPLHYGWVVECNPSTGKSKKLTSMGRFAHECATVVLSKEGYPVVYLADDKNDECLYKMVSKDKNSLDRGELFVADTVRGRWVSLYINKQPLLQKYFKDQTEVLIRTR
ncbi:MAG: DUF839 domain-containing protein [Bdellovibrionales bacterium]|nr:DUF839 domain-containing protein [Bdellovibrionales bacterium]